MHLFYDANNNDKSQLHGVNRYLQNSPDKPWPVKAFKGQIVSLTFSFECFRLKQCYARPFPVSVASSSSGVNSDQTSFEHGSSCNPPLFFPSTFFHKIFPRHCCDEDSGGKLFEEL